jgi:hypothetical protein
MTDYRDESSLSRIELVVLACLSQTKVTPTDSDLGDVVREFALPNEPADAARRRASELLGGLVRRRLVTGDNSAGSSAAKSTKLKPRKLTDEGKRVLRTAFNLPKTPTWAQVRDKHLPALALRKIPGLQPGQKTTEGDIVAALLCARFGIQGAHTPMDVCDALIADALGMPRGQLTMDALRVHILTRGIDNPAKLPRPEVKLTKSGKPSKVSYASQLATWVACTSVGVDSPNDKAKITQALARRWVCDEPIRPAPPPTIAAPQEVTVRKNNPPTAQLHLLSNPPSPPPPKQVPAPSAGLLQAVRDAIPRVGAEGRFGEKVYVSAIWRTMERERKAADLSLDNFKRWLLGANRDGWLVLARADLVGAMDPRQVSESEINDRGSTFHFVLDQRSGSAVSQRETYVR